MQQRNVIGLSVFIAVLMLASLAVRAQVYVDPVPAFTISAGYSNVQFQRGTGLFYDHSGGYGDVDAAWTLPTVVPIQVGIGATASGYSRRETFFDSNTNDYLYGYDHLYSDIGLFELEPRVGIRLGQSTGFFLTPRVGAGLLISNYAIDQSFTNSAGNTYINTQYHTGAAFEVRPAATAGYSWGLVSAGVEGSYMWSWGNFGGLGRHAEEYRVGAFVRIRF